MSALPTPENHHRWWLHPRPDYEHLHALAADTVDHHDEDDLDRLRWDDVTATAVCGKTAVWDWPGILSRLAKPRCPACCTAVGIPDGDGTPNNSASARGAES